MISSFFAWTLAGMAFLAALQCQGADALRLSPAQVEDFEKNIRPLLANRCLSCHGAEKQKGGLRLDSRTSMMQGGDSGPAIIPGAPDESMVIEAIRYGGDLQMPPKGKLKDGEIATMTRWIKEGAVWPETPESRSTPSASHESGSAISEADRQFWAFQPVKSSAPPSLKDPRRVNNLIDRFVFAKLEATGLAPVASADKRTLIRRATFDLTGLPPTLEEVQAFLKDESADAFDRVVERLLASPHYGERWGRFWLDVARYGEDQAHTFEARLYPGGYHYRDWVVKALNEDMPYDQFVFNQIAGDLVEGSDKTKHRNENLAALGYFALGPVYYGKAIHDELDDRVDTLTRGFLGLTVACARCHDHKFDPIPQRDYYALAGIFSNTEYKEYPRAPAEVVARYDAAQQAIKDKNDAISDLQRTESSRLSESLVDRTADYLLTASTLDARRSEEPGLSIADVAKAEGLDAMFLTRWGKFLEKPETRERAYLARWFALKPAQSNASVTSEQRAVAAKQVRDYLTSLLALRRAFEARESAAKQVGIEVKRPESLAALSAEESKALDDLVGREGLFAIPRDRIEELTSRETRHVFKTLKAELKELKKNAPPKYPVLHSLADRSNPSNMKLLLRGNPDTPGEEVPRHFLSILSQGTASPFQQGSGRLELARAIASPENPLTARVMVNRVWEHHFGRGLVGTPSNFGQMGERPTHPELLDYLAHRFVTLGWSLKALHREIMASATYQLSGADDARNHEVDPENRLLWRMNRRRLDVEAWRDAILAVSGTLDLEIGGPSLPLTSPDHRRRTLYSVISRHSLDGLLRLFDFPDPNITSDRRSVTTVPLQQLFVLNSSFMERQAKALADRLLADSGLNTELRVERAFQILFGRGPSENEITLAVRFLEGRGGDARAKWNSYAQVLLGTNEFAFVD